MPTGVANGRDATLPGKSDQDLVQRQLAIYCSSHVNASRGQF